MILAGLSCGNLGMVMTFIDEYRALSVKMTKNIWKFSESINSQQQKFLKQFAQTTDFIDFKKDLKNL